MAFFFYYIFFIILTLLFWHLLLSDQKRLKTGIFCLDCDLPLKKKGDFIYCPQCGAPDIVLIREEANKEFRAITKATIHAVRHVPFFREEVR